jgi:hypothetical protein
MGTDNFETEIQLIKKPDVTMTIRFGLNSQESSRN